MLGLVQFARSNTNKDTGAVYSSVEFIPLTPSPAENVDEAGYRSISVRSAVEPCLALRKAIRESGPLVAELELVPMIFGKTQTLELRAAKLVAPLDKLAFTVGGIRVKSQAPAA
jgi:hypothetical protein